MKTKTENQTERATPKLIRFDDGGFEVEFRPGQWAQFACVSHTRWTYPDTERNNAALAEASKHLPALIVKAVNSYALLLAVAEAARKMHVDGDGLIPGCELCDALTVLDAVRKEQS